MTIIYLNSVIQDISIIVTIIRVIYVIYDSCMEEVWQASMGTISVRMERSAKCSFGRC